MPLSRVIKKTIMKTKIYVSLEFTDPRLVKLAFLYGKRLKQGQKNTLLGEPIAHLKTVVEVVFCQIYSL